MATMLVMLEDLAERLYRESHWPVTGTATSGTTTTLVDTAGLVYSSGDANQFDRKYAYIEFSTGESSRVTEGGYAGGTGTLTLSPAVTDIGTEKYIITDQHIDVLKNAINRIQRNLFLETFYPLSVQVVRNDANDMEPATTATDYGGTATRALESTIIFNGAQSLKVTAGAANQYASVGAISVNEGETYYAAVMCSVNSGDDADFFIYDVTNATTINNATTDEVAWMELIVPFTVPSGCEEISTRMASVANGDITYWENFQVWSSGRRVYPLPSWITRPEQLLDVRSFAQGTGGPGDNDYRSNETRSRPLSYGFESVDRRGTSPLHIWVDNTSARPFIYALRPLDELSADTSNSVAESDFIVRFAEKLVREPDKASETMALLRAIHFQRVTTELPNRIGVSM